MPDETLAIIDGHYYAYKFFFGMPPLTGPGGRPTGVTYAFANLIKELRENHEITHWACVFDAPDEHFRSRLYPEYKAHRSPMPETLAQQIPDAERLCASSGMPVFKIPDFEADDVVATFAISAAKAGLKVRVLSKDKDLDQILDERISTWDPGKGILRGPAELLEEKGLRPGLVCDYLCMIGDAADNVRGIPGVGPKTALKLLASYGSLQGVIDHADELKGKLRESVKAFIPEQELTRELIRLRTVPGLPPHGTLAIDRSFRPDPAIYEEFGITRARLGTKTIESRPASTGAPYRILDLAGLPAYLDRLRRAGRCAIDTETTGLDPLQCDLVGISFAAGDLGGGDVREAAYLPFRGQGDAVPLEQARPILAAFLGDAAVGKIGQNIKFDHRVLAAQGLTVAGYVGDTMLASWLIDPSRESHGLDFLAKLFLDEDKIPTGAVIDLANGQTMADVPIAGVATYACEDAQCTWRLACVLEPELERLGLLQVYREQEVPIALCLARMEDLGIAVDPTILASTQRHLEQCLEQVRLRIAAVAGSQFNPASPKQVATMLFERLNLPVISRTKSGPSTDVQVLEALRHVHELPDLILQFRQLSKLIGTYLAKLPGHINPTTGRIHTNYKQTGTETGRLSSDQPNLQNIPKKSDIGREMRAAFVPGPGRLLLAADYSQIELRMLAHLSGDAVLLEAFHSGEDIHRFVAAQVNACDQAAVTTVQRQAAKAINFGIIYGQTAFGLSQGLGISRPEAQRFIDGYFARFSGVRTYIDRTIGEATRTGYAQTLSGRRRYIPQLASSNRNERLQGERIALNSTVQGSAADLIKRAMLLFGREAGEAAHLILQIHDELVIEATREGADRAADILHASMVDAWKLSVPLVAEVRRGASWLDVS